MGESEGPKGLLAAVGAGARGVSGSRESGILRECLQGDDGFSSITRTASRDFGRTPGSRGSSVTAMRGSWFFIGLKKTACPCGRQYRSFYDRKRKRVRDLSCGGLRVSLDIEIRRIECVSCGTVRQESLSFLADNRSYTKRFAFYVGRRLSAQETSAEASSSSAASAHPLSVPLGGAASRPEPTPAGEQGNIASLCSAGAAHDDAAREGPRARAGARPAPSSPACGTRDWPSTSPRAATHSGAGPRAKARGCR